jgi:uncharacterized membrane protein
MAALALLIAAAVPAWGQNYSVQVIPTPGPGAAASAVNDLGWVVGSYGTPDGDSRGFVWDGATCQTLAPLPGDAISVALSINTFGHIVGYSEHSSGIPRAVIWARTTQGVWAVSALGTLADAAWSVANKINSRGDIAGVAALTSGQVHAFLRTYTGGVTDLSTMGQLSSTGETEATGLNSVGKTVGTFRANTFSNDQSVMFGAPAVDITPTSYVASARPFDINMSNVVVGSFADISAGTGFVAGQYTSSGGWTAYGHLPGMTESIAFDNNDAGVAVGVSRRRVPSVSHAFVWINNQMVDLNGVAPGAPGVITEAVGINNSGLIAANGAVYNGSVALLLVPGAFCNTADFDRDGDSATDLDIEAFFACLAGACCPTCESTDINIDGDAATDADIEAFFRILAGGRC